MDAPQPQSPTIQAPSPPSTSTSFSTPTTATAPAQKTEPIVLNAETIRSLPAESFPASNNTNNLTWRTLLSTSPPHLTPSSNMCAGLASCPPHSGQLSLHRHTQAEIYYITSGRGIVNIEGFEHEVSAGSVLFIPGDAEHGVVNRGEEALGWFYVFPTAGFGDVVYRFSGEELAVGQGT
ncbi:RmlC-like cupin domain-containing protein [Aspergillus terricola var. indicus]